MNTDRMTREEMLEWLDCLLDIQKGFCTTCRHEERCKTRPEITLYGLAVQREQDNSYLEIKESTNTLFISAMLMSVLEHLKWEDSKRAHEGKKPSGEEIALNVMKSYPNLAAELKSNGIQNLF